MPTESSSFGGRYEAICLNTTTLSESESHRVIDEHLQEVEEYLYSLRRLRNNRTKLSQLPPELITNICIEATQPEVEFVATSWRDHVSLTAVCKSWRAILLDCPAFWSCIPLHPCNHLLEMLARSQQHPLSVRLQSQHSFNRRKEMNDQLLVDILPIILRPERLWEVHLSGDHAHHTIGLYLNHFPNQKLPFLTSINLECPTRIYPLHILSVPKPALKHLSLSLCHVPWDNFAVGDGIEIKNLVTLELHRLHPPPPERILHGILSSSPNLRRLVIRDTLPVSEQQRQSTDAPSIELNALKTLEVSGSLRLVSIFASSIKRPICCQTEFKCWGEGTMPVQQEGLDGRTNLFKDLLATVSGPCGFCPGSNGELNLNFIHEARRNITLSIRFRSRTSSVVIELKQALPHRDILHHLSVPDIQHLHISMPGASEGRLTNGSDWLTFDDWRTFFLRHTTLRNLDLSGQGKSLVLPLQALHISRESYALDPSFDAPALPCLESLILSNTYLGSGPLFVSNELFISLQDMLLSREETGLVLPKLDLRCIKRFNARMLGIFQLIFKGTQVSWDGVVNFSTARDIDVDSDEDRVPFSDEWEWARNHE